MKVFSLLLVKVTLLTIIFSSSLIADENQTKKIGIGDTFKSYNFENPNEEIKTLKPNTKLLLVSFEMELSKGIHSWLEGKEADYLEKHNAEYIADITKMPSIITYLFARPKMKKYAFPILLIKDENFAPEFPVEEGKFIAFELDESKKIKNMSYFQNMDEVEKAYFVAPSPTPIPSAAQSNLKKNK